MNLTDVILRVQRQFGDDDETIIEEADITRWANDAQMDLARKTKILTDRVQTNAIINQYEYDLPDDFIDLKWVSFDGTKLIMTTESDMDRLFPSRDVNVMSGTPQMFYVVGMSLFIYPAPVATGSNNLDIRYYKAPTTLVQASQEILDLPPFMHEDVVRYCLARARERDEDPAGAGVAMADYDSRVNLAMDAASNIGPSYPAIQCLPGDYGYDDGQYVDW